MIFYRMSDISDFLFQNNCTALKLFVNCNRRNERNITIVILIISFVQHIYLISIYIMFYAQGP